MWAGESARGDPVLVDQHLSLCHFGHLYFPLLLSCSFPAQALPLPLSSSWLEFAGGVSLPAAGMEP